MTELWATAGVREVPPAWIEQLAEGGPDGGPVGQYLR